MLECWSHARRKFVEAVEVAELESAEAVEVVNEVMKCGSYEAISDRAIERRVRDECLGWEDRLKLRQELARPILEGLQPRLESFRGKNICRKVRWAAGQSGCATR